MAFWNNKKKHKEEIELQVIQHLIEQDSEDRELYREYIRYQIKQDKHYRILFFILFLIGISSFLFISFIDKEYEELSHNALIIYIFTLVILIFIEYVFSEQKVKSFVKEDTLASYYMKLFEERWSKFSELVVSEPKKKDENVSLKDLISRLNSGSGWGLGIVCKDGKIEIVHWSNKQ